MRGWINGEPTVTYVNSFTLTCYRLHTAPPAAGRSTQTSHLRFPPGLLLGSDSLSCGAYGTSHVTYYEMYSSNMIGNLSSSQSHRGGLHHCRNDRHFQKNTPRMIIAYFNNTVLYINVPDCLLSHTAVLRLTSFGSPHHARCILD